MKYLLSIWMCMVLPIVIYSQTLSILDRESGEPVPFATLSSPKPSAIATADENGQVDISGFKESNKIRIQSLGYRTLEISYNHLKDSNFKVLLSPLEFLQEAVVVSATRWRQSSGNVPTRITTISPEEVSLQNPQTAADLLGISGKVFIQKSQQGGGSPMIRGFATNRLLYSVDGVRMNTAIFRGGNVQNVINLDPFAMENAEVLFGPGSVIYGSDAIGGVMSFQTLTPELAKDNRSLVSGKALARCASANNELTGHFDINLGWKKWALVTSVSSWNYDHLRQGSKGPDDYLKPWFVQRRDSMDVQVMQDDPLQQIPSAYDQLNLMQKVRFKPNTRWDLVYGFHYSETSSFGRYDRQNRLKDGAPRYGQWDYGPQKWMMNLLNIDHQGSGILYNQFSLRLAHQDMRESRITRNFNDPLREIRTENVDAWSINLDLTRAIDEDHTLFYGLEYVRNDVHSEGVRENIETGNTEAGPSRYPMADWQSAAIYINEEFRVSPKLILQGGLRYNLYDLRADFTNNQSFYSFPFQQANLNNGSLTGSLGGVYRPDNSVVIRMNTGTAFRSPNVDDIGKVFDSEPGAVVVPNPDLASEYAWNIDLSIAKVFGEHLKIDLTGYYTFLDNALVRRNFQLNGMDSIVYEGTPSQVQAIQNAASANVWGIQAGLEIRLSEGFRLSSDLNYQEGEEEGEDGMISPSRHVAPLFGVTRLSYRKNGLNLQVYARYQGAFSHDQLSVSEREKTDIYALDKNGNTYAPSWYTLNFNALYEISETFTLSSGLENITDQRYRPYSSGISGPGRNFLISVTVRW